MYCLYRSRCLGFIDAKTRGVRVDPIKRTWTRESDKNHKGMGITSKYYRDRSMLSEEEGGTENKWDNSNDDD